jgi:hypothetical protein
MKIWSSQHVFDHPWSTVAHAVWRKYPNPLKPEVTALDVLERNVGKDGVLRSTRIIETEWNIPGWATKLIGLTNPSYSYEYSEVQHEDQTMTIKSVNLNCTHFVSVDETLQYKPHPDDPSKTLMEQSTAITVRNIPLISYFENFLADNIGANSVKGPSALELVINNIKRDYEEMGQKLSTEYEALSTNVRHSMEDLSQKARYSVDEIRKELEADFSAVAGSTSRNRLYSTGKSP